MNEVNLESRLRTLAESHAGVLEVIWHVDLERVSWVRFSPRGHAARDVSLAWSAHEIIIGFGQDGRIELGPPEDDEDLAIQIATAVVKGEVFQRKMRGQEIWVRVDADNWIGTHGAYGQTPSSIESMKKYEPY